MLESTRNYYSDLNKTMKDASIFTQVKNKKQEKKDKQKKKKEEEEKKKKEEEEKKKREEENKKNDVKHFLRNGCRHGFLDNAQWNRVGKWRFDHPEVCRSYLNNRNGLNGCQN